MASSARRCRRSLYERAFFRSERRPPSRLLEQLQKPPLQLRPAELGIKNLRDLNQLSRAAGIAQADVRESDVVLRAEPTGRSLAAVALDLAPFGQGRIERRPVADFEQRSPIRLLNVAVLGIGGGELGE